MHSVRMALANIRRVWANLATAHPTLRRTLPFLPLPLALNEYIGTVYHVTGESMQPTLNPVDSAWRDVVLLDRYSIRLRRSFHRGDIVMFKRPSDAKLVIKRIVALPGDTVKTLPPYRDSEVKVPDGHAWLEGDESFKTEDSNTLGPIPLGLIDSRAHAILWPPGRFGRIVPPNLAKEQEARNGRERGPAWRKEMADFERERKRQARVSISTVPPG